MSHAPAALARDRFLKLLEQAVSAGALVKLTLGAYRGADPTLRHLYVRPVTLKAGPHLSFVWRHETRDITKNHPPAEALAALAALIGEDFRSAHLFTPAQVAQLEWRDALAEPRLTVKTATAAPPPTTAGHDRAKQHPVAADTPWLRALGITGPHGSPREGMAAKFRQIQKFTELIQHFTAEAPLPADRPWQVCDMGSGKGYLTFAAAAALAGRAQVLGVEQRPELVALCNEAATASGLEQLRFVTGTISDAAPATVDVLIALHACDTATDDALAAGIATGAVLMLAAPCCQKELRPQLTPPPVLAPALRHGVWQERHAEFATDALRALLLESAGWHVQALEFVSTEHTAKNVMLAAVREPVPPAEAERTRRAAAVRALAGFYGVRHHRLAEALGFDLLASN